MYRISQPSLSPLQPGLKAAVDECPSELTKSKCTISQRICIRVALKRKRRVLPRQTR